MGNPSPFRSSARPYKPWAKLAHRRLQSACQQPKQTETPAPRTPAVGVPLGKCRLCRSGCKALAHAGPAEEEGSAHWKGRLHPSAFQLTDPCLPRGPAGTGLACQQQTLVWLLCFKKAKGAGSNDSDVRTQHCPYAGGKLTQLSGALGPS